MTQKWFRTMIAVEFEAESAEEAQKCTDLLIKHIWRTGADSNLPCPESMAIEGETILVGEATA